MEQDELIAHLPQAVGWDSGGGGCGICLGEDQDGALLVRALHMCVYVRMYVCVCVMFMMAVFLELGLLLVFGHIFLGHSFLQLM